MNDKNVDPKLKAALKEIEKVMDRYNCGGIISLHSKTHTEFKFHLPRWALFRFITGDKPGIHIKHRGETNPGDTVSTYHLLFDAQEVCGRFFMLIDNVRLRLKECGIEVDYTPFSERT